MKYFIFRQVRIVISKPESILHFAKFLIVIFISCYSFADDDILYSDYDVGLSPNDGDSRTIECRVVYSYKPAICGAVRCVGGVATQTCPAVKNPKNRTKCSCINRTVSKNSFNSNMKSDGGSGPFTP